MQLFSSVFVRFYTVLFKAVSTFLCLFFSTSFLRYSFFLILFFSHSLIWGQTPLKVYLDEETNLDADFIRNELRMFDFVRHRNLSDVQVMQVEEYIGRRKLIFIGYGQFEGQNDTVYVEINPVLLRSSNFVLEQYTHTIKAGLLPYLLQTEWESHLVYDLDSEKKPNYPWNVWLYEVSALGCFDKNENREGDLDTMALMSSEQNGEFQTSFRVNKFTKKRHFSSSIFYKVEGNKSFDTTFGERKNKFDFLFLEGRYVEAIGLKMAIGGSANLSKVLNTSSKFSGGAESFIAYHFIPFDQFFQRTLSIQYGLSYNFKDSPNTIMGDSRFSNLVRLFGSRLEKWGRISANASFGYRFEKVLWNAWDYNLGASTVFNIGKGLYLSPEVQYRRNNYNYSVFGPSPVYTKDFRSYNFQFSLGILYAFGAQWTSPVNPRINNLFYYY